MGRRPMVVLQVAGVGLLTAAVVALVVLVSARLDGSGSAQGAPPPASKPSDLQTPTPPASGQAAPQSDMSDPPSLETPESRCRQGGVQLTVVHPDDLAGLDLAPDPSPFAIITDAGEFGDGKDGEVFVLAKVKQCLSAGDSYDPGGLAIRFAWDLNDDGAFETKTPGPSVMATFTEGDHLVTLRVTNSAGSCGEDRVTVHAMTRARRSP